jgi:hypothetical protein
MDGFAVFIRAQIGRKVERLAANYAVYFLESVTAHGNLLWTLTSSVAQGGMQD